MQIHLILPFFSVFLQDFICFLIIKNKKGYYSSGKAFKYAILKLRINRR